MKFTIFIALASLSASAFSANVDTFRADVQHLADTATTWGNSVLAFPRTIGLKTVADVQKIALNSGIVVDDLRKLILDAAVGMFPFLSIETCSRVRMLHHQSVTTPLAVADGLALVALFNPIAQGAISVLQALQDRKAAIAAVPSLGPINALVIMREAVTLATTTTLAFKAAFAKSVFTLYFGLQADALDAWILLCDSVIKVENATILLFNSV
ncbi:hypothetical protein DXG01_013072 [Tephrocybe rancida]|nr:hypothetical protein DXG01_013072 [Tephrocybe rancida]